MLANTNAMNRRFVVDQIGLYPVLASNAAPAVPLLIQCLHDVDPEVREMAAASLGRIALEPAQVVPALTNCLSVSATPLLRVRATWALGVYREHARAAMPSLLNELTDPDPDVREAATNALRLIAPEVLTNTPPR
jgi:HEAT repeat protein